jgi:hypothetical protein
LPEVRLQQAAAEMQHQAAAWLIESGVSVFPDGSSVLPDGSNARRDENEETQKKQEPDRPLESVGAVPSLMKGSTTNPPRWGEATVLHWLIDIWWWIVLALIVEWLVGGSLLGYRHFHHSGLRRRVGWYSG